ncbi:hypothetical protein PpBr36_07044 [Pyricularia pennisetigena]|uniref:hypothetical protein n=1 Tax=Pyricularia pennisetigena TaxID=1578925 RepID=UPI0011542019|nr:hypothetical protein PpBr36_07044 [Pyricularia pennisetigena]TLS25811.1 hypothetical protein PpBr36_07044 [Pyricularia pennisetigena]
MHPKWLRRLCRRSVDSPQQPTVQSIHVSLLLAPSLQRLVRYLAPLPLWVSALP